MNLPCLRPVSAQREDSLSLAPRPREGELVVSSLGCRPHVLKELFDVSRKRHESGQVVLGRRPTYDYGIAEESRWLYLLIAGAIVLGSMMCAALLFRMGIGASVP
jgi:hypothetical protein